MHYTTKMLRALGWLSGVHFRAQTRLAAAELATSGSAVTALKTISTG